MQNRVQGRKRKREARNDADAGLMLREYWCESTFITREATGEMTSYETDQELLRWVLPLNLELRRPW